MEYSPQLKEAAAQLAASQKQLDLVIQSLPANLSSIARDESTAKLKEKTEARCDAIKQAYNMSITWNKGNFHLENSIQFRRFAELPTTIQNLVWAFALPGPRTVPIVWKTVSKGLMSPCAVPTILHVCQASRKVALTSGYELAFATSERTPSIYFNFTIDTAYFEDMELLCNVSRTIVARDYLSLVSVQRIRKLAVGLEPLVRPPLTHGPSASVNFEKSLFQSDQFRDLESVILAPFITYEWLRYGEMNPSEFLQYLIPVLGRHAYFWRVSRQDSEKDGYSTSFKNVDISLLTNARLYPWMTQRVQANWDAALQHNFQKTFEFQLDSEQVIAIARANMSVFDEFAKIWDAEYVERAWMEFGMLNQDSYQGSEYFKLRDPLWQRVKNYPIRYLERPLSNDEIDAQEAERKRVEKLRLEALKVMATRDGPPPPGTVRVGPAPPYKEIRFA